MRDTMGIIYTGGGEENLKELTRSRSIAAVPFAGRYRMIDFILSNMVNSGIYNVGLITQNNYHSLMDHLDSGKQWDLDRKRDGLFILPPYVSRNNTGWYKGKIDALHNIMAYIRRSTQKYVVIAISNMVCNLTYDDLLGYHKENNADITVLYKEEEEDTTLAELSACTLIRTDENNRIWDMEVMPAAPQSRKVSMEMYIMEKDLLEYLVEESVARGLHDFTKEILIKKLDDLRIFGYPYTGYLAKIDSIQSYFRYNIELLNPENREDLFHHCGAIYTKIKDEVPAKYGNDCKIENSMVADGCIVEGDVENCILFRGVRIAKGAVVKNSIVMQNAEIQTSAWLENVIMDKEVIIRRGRRLIGQESYPVVIGKRAII